MKVLSPEKLNLLLELSEIINSTIELSEVKKRAIESAMKTFDAEAGSIMLLDPHSGDLFFDTALGEKGEEIKTVRIPRGRGIGGWVVQNKRPVIINNVQEDKRFFKDADCKSGFKTINMMCAPLATRHKLIGVLQIINKKDGDFNEDDLTLLIALSNQIAIAIENALFYEELRETFYSTIHALADAVEKRDTTISGHTKRVTRYCMATAKVLNLSAKDTVNLKIASILHDIGKITLPDRLLQDSQLLKYPERHLYEMHPVYGAEIISHIKTLKDILPVIRHHHEKYNGSGYPDGLQGDDIPFLSRIICVSDVFDTMTRQNQMSLEDALKEIKSKAWVEFDGEVVMAFSIGIKRLQD